jgi:multiple sugar transport system permease protein
MEAARMEGAGEFRIFHRIIIPMSAPAMATMGILTFVFLWNNYITPLMLLVSTDKFPVQVVLALLSTDQERRVGATYLGLSLSIILILIVYVTQSRRITENVAAGAVKG